MDATFPGGASWSSPAAAERGAAGAGLEGGARGRGRLFRAVSHDHSGHCLTSQVPIFTACLNNRLEQDHRSIKGRYRPMRGFKCPRSAARFCRAYDELRNFLRSRSRHHQHVPADCRRLLHRRRTATVLAILQAA